MDPVKVVYKRVGHNNDIRDVMAVFEQDADATYSSIEVCSKKLKYAGFICAVKYGEDSVISKPGDTAKWYKFESASLRAFTASLKVFDNPEDLARMVISLNAAMAGAEVEMKRWLVERQAVLKAARAASATGIHNIQVDVALSTVKKMTEEEFASFCGRLGIPIRSFGLVGAVECLGCRNVIPGIAHFCGYCGATSREPLTFQALRQ